MQTETSARVLSDQHGVTIIHDGDTLREVFVAGSEASDGNSLGQATVEQESERQRIIRERFGDSLGGSAGVQGSASHAKVVKAPMPGMVKVVCVEVGSHVKKSTTVIILEAMKMENSIAAGTDGVVTKLLATQGVSIEKNAAICEITPQV